MSSVTNGSASDAVARLVAQEVHGRSASEPEYGSGRALSRWQPIASRRSCSIRARASRSKRPGLQLVTAGDFEHQRSEAFSDHFDEQPAVGLSMVCRDDLGPG